MAQKYGDDAATDFTLAQYNNTVDTGARHQSPSVSDARDAPSQQETSPEFKCPDISDHPNDISHPTCHNTDSVTEHTQSNSVFHSDIDLKQIAIEQRKHKPFMDLINYLKLNKLPPTKKDWTIAS